MTFSGFCDFCLNPDNTDPQFLRKILSRLYELGYKNVAINQEIDESIFENERKSKKKKSTDSEVTKTGVPEPIDLTDLKNEFINKLTILNRLTFVFGDTIKVHTLEQSQILKKYDLFGVVPKNQAALQFICSQLNTDIVTIKSSYPGLKFSRKLYRQATERGIHFEIRYSDILNETTRQFALRYSHLFYIFGKSKNVVISSGAKDENLLRNPYDIINLGCILGLNETQAKASVLRQCQYLFAKAEGRRYGKAVFAIYTNVDDDNKEQKKIKRDRSVKRKKIES